MRRFFAVVTLAVALAGCGEEKKRDVLLNIVGEALPPLMSLEEIAKEYAVQTGVKVKAHPFEFETALQKAQLDFTSGRGEYDLVMGIFYNHGRYVESGYITPFDDPKFSNVLPADEVVSTDAFYPALQNAVMLYKGQRIAYPFSAQTMFLWFRKDLFSDESEKSAFKQRYGYDLPIPDEKRPLTWIQFGDIAQFFTRNRGERLAGTQLDEPMYGVALQMKRHPASFYEFTNFVFSFGGRFFDDNGRPDIDSVANREALEFYVGLKKFAPPGAMQSTWDDALAQMQQGRVAMTIMWSDAPSDLYDEKASKVVGKVGYSLVPIRPEIGRKVAVFGGWGFLINARSKHQEDAYKFVQWISQPAQQLKWAKMGGLPGAKAIFSDPEYIKIPYMSAQNDALQFLVAWPRDPKAEQFVSAGIETLSLATAEQVSPQQALKELQSKTEQLYGKR
jgi:multiple sugar transport system substrate-binding protein